MGGEQRALPILEAAGSIRLLKLCRYYEGASLLFKAFSRSIDQLFVPLFMLSVMVICFGSIIYNIEVDEGTFRSIPHAMWFLVVTVSTVGYGDVSPTSVFGQFFISAVIFLGIIFLAMPLSVVGNNFQHVWDERSMFKLQALTQRMLSENDMSPDDCLAAFKEFDVDGDGLIDEKEFAHFVIDILGLQLKKPELAKLWAMLDSNLSGSVNYAEFGD